MLNEAFLRARGHLVHVVCRAQTHCNRDLLWHRLLAGGTGEEEKDGGKRGRRRSEVRRSGSDYSLKLTGMKGLDTLYPGADQVTSNFNLGLGTFCFFLLNVGQICGITVLTVSLDLWP